mmetsp:Transcript_29649/g.88749  ORF Transcript_29649/g.88749 Transcript_29649/m.88749 type:complete len:527 (-) Transcript_29649:450-2030(-)
MIISAWSVYCATISPQVTFGTTSTAAPPRRLQSSEVPPLSRQRRAGVVARPAKARSGRLVDDDAPLRPALRPRADGRLSPPWLEVARWSLSIRHGEVERLVCDEAPEEEVGMVVEPVVELVLVQPEQHLASHVEVRHHAQHRLDEDAEHVRVEPAGDAANVLLLAPVEHHLGEGRVELDLELLAQLRGRVVHLLQRRREGRKLPAGSLARSLSDAPFAQKEADPTADLRQREPGQPAVRDDGAHDEGLPVRKRGARAAARCERLGGREAASSLDELEVGQPTHRRRPVVAQRRPRRLELRLERLAAGDRRADLREVVSVLGAQGAHLGASVLLLLRRQPDRGAAEVARGAGEPLLERRVPVSRLDAPCCGRIAVGALEACARCRHRRLYLGCDCGGAAAHRVVLERAVEDLGADVALEVAQDEGAVDRELRDSRGHPTAEHLAQLDRRREVSQPRHRQSRRVNHVPKLVHAAPARSPRHLPKLIRAQRPVAGRVAVVRLVKLRKDDGARGHVDADGKRLRREDELH